MTSLATGSKFAEIGSCLYRSFNRDTNGVRAAGHDIYTVGVAVKRSIQSALACLFCVTGVGLSGHIVEGFSEPDYDPVRPPFLHAAGTDRLRDDVATNPKQSKGCQSQGSRSVPASFQSAERLRTTRAANRALRDAVRGSTD